MQEWDDPERDLAQAVDIVPERVIDFMRERVIPKVAFDDSMFTRRELRLMQDLSAHFADELTKPLIGFTHEERGPWDKIWDGGKGNFRYHFARARDVGRSTRLRRRRRGYDPTPGTRNSR